MQFRGLHNNYLITHLKILFMKNTYQIFFIVLILMLVSFLAGYSLKTEKEIIQTTTTTTLMPTTTVILVTEQQCINNARQGIFKHATWNKPPVAGENYVIGEILLGFGENINKNTALNFITENGLSVKNDLWSLKAFLVEVPEGSEISWICKLQNNEIVRYAELNGIGSIA